MARIALEPLTHSPVKATAYREQAGKRVPAPNARAATMWRTRCRFRKADGTLVDLTRWAPTRREAEARMGAAIADLKVGGRHATVRPSTPLTEAGEAWLAALARPDAGRAPKTLEAYRGAWERYIVAEGSALRGLSLSSANDVQRVLGLLRDVADRHGTGAAKMARTVLSGLFGWAVRMGVLDLNAARNTGTVKAVEPRESSRDKRRSLTATERDAAIAAADAWAREARELEGATRGVGRTVRTRETVADLVAFLAGTGVRISEARMLRWDRVDLEAGTVLIEGTKTASSVRLLSLPQWLSERLAGRGRAYGQHGYVFASPGHVAGQDVPMDSSNLASAVRRVLDRAGLDWATSHTFRRTVATRLHEAGAPLVRIADQLGHANPTMTANVYLGRDLRGDKADLAAML
ncbi:MAG: tyrosine-type recombinase/integrase [Micropruina sp.]|uniref:tyrosine-type recombinase/integrase n=1 Tax=Micropruina sp. TaxID=2737536 RepID=UPI0039E25B47